MLSRFVLPALVCIMAASPAAAVTVGQLDDFEDGTTQGWTVGGGPGGGVSPLPPTNIATGGPQGLGDNYLLLASSGSNGAGGRLTAFNSAQWAGDYLAAGIGGIGLWARNFGPTDLSLRLVVENPMGAPPTDLAFSAHGVTVQSGGVWQRVFLSLDPDDLQADVGTAIGALSNVTVLRLYHSDMDEFPGDPAIASLGVDDIRAVAVPEPAAWSLLIAGFGMAGALLRRRPRFAPA